MESLYLLIPLSLIFVGIAVGIFFWAVKSGQYDDLEREADRILFDDDDSDGFGDTKTKTDDQQPGLSEREIQDV